MSDLTGALLNEYASRVVELESQLAAKDEEIARLREKNKRLVDALKRIVFILNIPITEEFKHDECLADTLYIAIEALNEYGGDNGV